MGLDDLDCERSLTVMAMPQAASRANVPTPIASPRIPPHRFQKKRKTAHSLEWAPLD